MATKALPKFEAMTTEQLNRAEGVLSNSSISCEKRDSDCAPASLDLHTAQVAIFGRDIHIRCLYHARQYASAEFFQAKLCLPEIQDILRIRQLEANIANERQENALREAQDAKEQKELTEAEAFLLHGQPRSFISDSDLERMLKQSTSGKCWLPSFCGNEEATCFVLVPGEFLDVFAAGPHCAGIAVKGENAKTHPVEPCLKFLRKLREERQAEQQRLDEQIGNYFRERGSAAGKTFSDPEIEHKIREQTPQQRAEFKDWFSSERK